MKEMILPDSVHIFLAIATVVFWLVHRFISGRNSPVGEPVPLLNYYYVSIVAVTAIGFTLFVYYAFTTRQMISYELEERWEWLDNSYVYRAIYRGEWGGVAWLYLTPLVLPFIISLFLASVLRSRFIKTCFRRYPAVILLAYAFTALTLSSLGVNLQRSETYPTEERPEAPGEWRN